MSNSRKVDLSLETINRLDNLSMKKVKESIKDHTFDIAKFVQTKRGVSYDKEINYLLNFYEIGYEIFNGIDDKCNKIKEIKELLQKTKKINSIY